MITDLDAAQAELRAENERFRAQVDDAASEVITLEWSLSEAEKEVEWLRAQNAELHRQIDYSRSLVWDDISDEQIVANLRHMLDRPKLPVRRTKHARRTRAEADHLRAALTEITELELEGDASLDDAMRIADEVLNP